MSEQSVFPRDAEQARLDAELTRQELGETVQELTSRLRTTYQRVAVGAGAALTVFIVVSLVLRRFMNRR
jgi:hypothetical protein